VRATEPETLQSPQGGRPRPPSFSSTCHALSLAESVTRGEPRCVHPSQPQCWFLPVTRVCPTVMPSRTPHLRSSRLRSIVRIYAHGSKDRAKDASPSACDDLSCLRWVHTLRERMLTSFPSSAAFGHPLSSARLLAAGIPLLAKRTDLGLRSDDPPRRVPPSRKPGCLSPSRHAKEFLSRRDFSLRPSRRLSRSRRPHFIPGWGQCF